MTDESSINARAHIAALDTAVQELMSLEARTLAPAPLPHQYVGTAVDNACALITATANALDGGCRSISFSETRNWLSLMKGVHRAFFSSIHTVAEAGLVALCSERGVNVRSRLRVATEQTIAVIEAEAGRIPKVKRAIRDLRSRIRGQRPAFDDFLEGALSTVKLPPKTRTMWRQFFAALSVVRNKASHSDPSLSESERIRLRAGGLGSMISANGTLVMNARMYAQVARFLLDFFDVLCNEANVIARRAS